MADNMSVPSLQTHSSTFGVVATCNMLVPLVVNGNIADRSGSEVDVDNDCALQGQKGQDVAYGARYMEWASVSGSLLAAGTASADDKGDSSCKVAKKCKVCSTVDSEGEGEVAVAVCSSSN